MYLVAILFFFLSREKGHVAALLTLKAKWFSNNRDLVNAEIVHFYANKI